MAKPRATEAIMTFMKFQDWLSLSWRRTELTVQNIENYAHFWFSQEPHLQEQITHAVIHKPNLCYPILKFEFI